MLFLVTTCVLSWYVAAGNIILTHLDAVHSQEREIKKKVALMMTGGPSDQAKGTDQTAAAAAVVSRAKSAGKASDHIGDPSLSAASCRLYVETRMDRSKAGEPFQLCSSLDEKEKEHQAIGSNLGGWLGRMAPKAGNFEETRASNEEFSRIFTQVLVSSVLPFFYGILGAGAAIVRDLWAKMRESMLAPRDFTLATGQLALGAIIGACISLFISPGVAGTQNDSILGSFVLTGSALSFVAGFGVEGVFQALESLVRRIFNSNDPTKK